MVFHPVVAGALLDRLHLGLKFLHPRHRDIGFARQREDQQLEHEGQRDDRPAHIADQGIEPVQQAEDRLGQEIEPAPVDRIDETVDAGVFLIAVDGFPDLGAGEQIAGRGRGRAGGDGLHRHPGLGLVDVGAGGVFHHRREGLPRCGRQRRHPVFVGKADPAVFLNADQLGRPLARDGGKLGHVLVFLLEQLAVGHADDTLMQHEEVLGVGFAVAGQNAIGRGRKRRGAGIFQRLGDGEQELVVQLIDAAEDLAGAIVPTQRDRLARRQRGAGFDLPHGGGSGDQRGVGAGGGHPAIDGVIGFLHHGLQIATRRDGAALGQQLGLRGRRQQPDIGRFRVQRIVIAGQFQIVDPAARQRNRPGKRGRFDLDPRSLGRGVGIGSRLECRRACRLSGGTGRSRGGGPGRLRGLRRLGRGRRRFGGEEDRPDKHDDGRKHHRQNEIAVVVFHSGAAPSS